MSDARSNLDAILVIFPMVAVMLAGLFRLDSLLAQPEKKRNWGRDLSGRNADGELILRDPDGTPSGVSGRALDAKRSGRLRRSASPPERRHKVVR